MIYALLAVTLLAALTEDWRWGVALVVAVILACLPALFERRSRE